MTSHSSSRGIPFGAAKFFQDIATLINNSQGSDVQFKVGGSISSQENGKTVYDESTTVTLYAHSLILRCRSPYFVALLDGNKDWKEESKCVIHKPEISPNTLQCILQYIYTGDLRAESSDNIVQLITTANEMGLEELSIECQNELMRTVRNIFSDKDEGSTKHHIPVEKAVHTHIIPALNLASNNSMPNLSNELLAIMLPQMSAINKTPDAYTTFINEISSEALIKIISSDDLAMTERSVCDLAIDWGCHQTKLSKTAIEARLSNLDDDEDGEEELSDGRTVISRAQLKQFKKILTPLLPAIRFSLLDPDEYRSMVNTLSFILPRRRYLEINEYFLNPDGTGPLDAPRKTSVQPKKAPGKHSGMVGKHKAHSGMSGINQAYLDIVVEPKVVESKIIVETTTWELLRKNIFETGDIAGCHSSKDLKFKLLFRASEHEFLVSAFHRHCDNKGPTLFVIRSSDGHLFGGVNFNNWESPYPSSHSPSALNFLFALPDGRHRKNSEIFRIKDTHTQYSSCNHVAYGPTFGGGSTGCDLFISNSANANNNSHSYLPSCYDGRGASITALAGSRNFIVSDYEVFAISK